MLQNVTLLAIVAIHTAANEPPKVRQVMNKIHRNVGAPHGLPSRRDHSGFRGRRRRLHHLPPGGDHPHRPVALPHPRGGVQVGPRLQPLHLPGLLEVAGLSGRLRLRAELRALTQAALLAEFQKSSKLPPCGTARQRGRGVFDGAAAWAWGFWTLRKSGKISSKFVVKN